MSVPAPARTPAVAEPPPRPSGWSALRPLVLRLHFYAGLLIAPFLLVAAATGLLYAGSLQAEKIVYAHELRTEPGGTALPLARQVDAALRAHPEGTVTAVRPPDGPDATTRVILDAPGLQDDNSLAVFVDPYTGKVRGALESYGSSGALPLRATIDHLHRDLLLGEPGRLYSELAASWLWVVALGGVLLWLGRRRSARRLRGTTGRRRTLSWHGTVGLWSAVGLVALSATGLTWSAYAGEHIGRLQDALGGATPAVSTQVPGAATEMPGMDHGAHAGHEGHTGHEGHAGHEGHGGGAGRPLAGLDATLRTARAEGLSGPVEIRVPTASAPAFVVQQTDKEWPAHLDSIAVDPASGRVTDRLDFADHPLLAKATRWGIDLHMGLLFGLANQVALAALMIALILLVVWGYRMWWQRRPRRDAGLRGGRAHPRGAWRRVPVTVLLPLAAATAVLGWFLPLFGIPLAGFLVLDACAGALARRRARAA
ncbi:PepSY-associated TM helix domain-containing protein [Streptomyces sp. CA-132043]|uniref:PepSY-associated TM helix domain-containing protein n=1 Tax=Streptomyces sp. CA-132043 TaxID=3240048 RepID=UPI003D930205